MATTPSGSTKKTGKKHGKSKSKPAKKALPLAPITVGDIVQFTSEDGQTVFGPGRVCESSSFGQFCVMFGDGIGCTRVDAARLGRLPAGSTAPTCENCIDC